MPGYKMCKSVGTSLPTEMLKQIDYERGDISRSRFILRLLETAYGVKKKEETKVAK
jgi:metal-responsive CopG/Arc/MetJ family transcriptional regulator